MVWVLDTTVLIGLAVAAPVLSAVRLAEERAPVQRKVDEVKFGPESERGSPRWWAGLCALFVLRLEARVEERSCVETVVEGGVKLGSVGRRVLLEAVQAKVVVRTVLA